MEQVLYELEKKPKPKPKTKGLARILKENGWDKAYMQHEWDKVLEALNAGCWSPVKAFIDDGYNWDNLPPHLMTQIPGLADRMWEYKRQQDAEKEAEKKREEELKNSRQYYIDHFEEVLLSKIDRGEKLTEEEISDFVDELPHYDEEYGDNRRWSRGVTTYVQTTDGRFFRVNWEEGLTEYQENSYWEQPVEVALHEEEKTITVIERTWTEVNKD